MPNIHATATRTTIWKTGLSTSFRHSDLRDSYERQMDTLTKKKWRDELSRNRTKKLDAPSWLWSCVVELLVSHEGEYLEHCRKYAMGSMT
jgi:hypothetical protein